jgi:hypothetical protein
MPAGVNVDFYAIDGDPRYDRLASLAGFADRDHARGKLEHVWKFMTENGTHLIPIWMVDVKLGKGGAWYLVQANLADPPNANNPGGFFDENANNPGGFFDEKTKTYKCSESCEIRIRGGGGRTDWLKRNRSNGDFGKLGGRPRKTHNNPPGLLGNASDNHLQKTKKRGGGLAKPIITQVGYEKKREIPENPSGSGSGSGSEDLSAGEKMDAAAAKIPRARAEISSSWKASEKEQQQAIFLGLNPQTEADRFKAHAASTNRQFSDTDGAFAAWLIESHRRKGEVQISPSRPGPKGDNRRKLGVL